MSNRRSQSFAPAIKTSLVLLVGIVCFVGSSASAAPGGSALAIPDFTQGDTIPANARHDWNLGPTGLRGWMFCDQLVTTDARQIAITAVDQGSPADGLIAVGDVLLGAGAKSIGPITVGDGTKVGANALVVKDVPPGSVVTGIPANTTPGDVIA